MRKKSITIILVLLVLSVALQFAQDKHQFFEIDEIERSKKMSIISQNFDKEVSQSKESFGYNYLEVQETLQIQSSSIQKQQAFKSQQNSEIKNNLGQINSLIPFRDSFNEQNQILTPRTRLMQQIETISKQFEDIELQKPIPTYLVVGQTYEINGRVVGQIANAIKDSQKVGIFILFGGPVSQFRCYGVIQENKQFSINCKLLNPGIFLLMFETMSFKRISSQPRFLEVKQSNTPIQPVIRPVVQPVVQPLIQPNISPTQNKPSTGIIKINQNNIQTSTSQNSLNPYNFVLQIENNQLIARWQTKGLQRSSALSNITVVQGGKRKTIQRLASSGFYQFDPIQFKQFEQNTQTTLYFSIPGASNKIFIKRFLAVEHKFEQTVTGVERTRISQIPYQVEKGSTLVLKGSLARSLRNTALLQSPTDKFIQIKLVEKLGQSETLKPGTLFSTKLQFQEEGAYLLEVNLNSGIAIINKPIYVGNAYPLTPDLVDYSRAAFENRAPPLRYLQQYLNKKLNSQFTEPPLTSSVTIGRSYLLMLTNALRKRFGVGSLTQDNSLNQLSQQHAVDMLTNNFIGHVNKKGESPRDRALKLGFRGNVGENIASAFSLTEIFLSLWRSTAHLINSVKPGWQRVGFGITRKQSGLFIVVFTFSTRDLQKKPLTGGQLQQFRNQLVSFALKKNPAIESEDPRVSSAITEWLGSGRQANLFNIVMQKTGYMKGFSASSWTITFTPDFMEAFQKINGFPSNLTKFSRIGVGVYINDPYIEIYFVFVV